MPSYTITDPDSGRVVRLTGDSPPTEAEINDLFKVLPKSDKPAAPVVAPPGNNPDWAARFAAANATPNSGGNLPPMMGIDPGKFINTDAIAAKLGVMKDWLTSDKAQTKMADVAIQGGLPAIGQRIAGPAGGFAGGAIAEGINQARAIGRGEQQDVQPGAIFGSGLVGAVGPRNLAGAPMGTVMAEGAKLAAANAAGKVAEGFIDKGEMPDIGELGQAASAGGLAAVVGRTVGGGKAAQAEAQRMRQAALRDESLRLANEKGFLLDPALANPTITNKAVEKMSGTSALQNQMREHNAQVATQLAKAEIGVHPDMPLSDLRFAVRQKEIAEPYRVLASQNATAEQAVKTWEEASSDARAAWQRFRNTGDTGARDAAKKFESMASDAEMEMERQARASNNHGLIQEIKDAKRDLAKLHVVESATNTATGTVDPTIIAQIRDMKGRGYLTGDLEIMARLAKAMPQVVGDVTSQSFGKTAALTALKGSAMAGGYAAMGPAGGALAAGAVGTIPPLLKKAAMSQPYQAFMNTPKYATDRPDMMQAMAQFGTQSVGR